MQASIRGPSVGHRGTGRTRFDGVVTVPRERWFAAVLAIAFAMTGPSSPRAAEIAQPPRYTASWDDGREISGDRLGPWYRAEHQPGLAGQTLPIRGASPLWLRQSSLPPAGLAGSWIEFWGWDRLPGRVVGVRSAEAGQPAHLLVAAAGVGDRPGPGGSAALAVLPRWVRRVVCEPAAPRYQPATLLCRDGRRIAIRAVRLAHDAFRVLRPEGVEEVPLAAIAELHFPACDAWENYRAQLAELESGPSGTLLQIESAEGLRATTSVERFRADRTPADEDPAHWYHFVRPAWSRDGFWMPLRQIRGWRWWPAAQVPLECIEPAAVRRRGEISDAWQWHAGRNVQGGPLASGGRQHAWGFGVQATCELEFVLPAGARRFRSRLGLDWLAGSGGCVRPEVLQYNGNAKTTLYPGTLQIGSREVRDTGWLDLAAGNAAPRRLVLRVGSASREGPPGTDPFDIRDIFDWLEPVIALDAGWLQSELAGRKP